MKKLMLAAVAATTCGCGPTANIDGERVKSVSGFGAAGRVYTLVHDDHWFVARGSSGGLTHHPGCPCLRTETQPAPTVVTNFVKTGREDRGGGVTMRHRGDGVFEVVLLPGGYTNYLNAPEGFRKVKDIHGDEVIVPACPEVKLFPGSLLHSNGPLGNPFLNAVP